MKRVELQRLLTLAELRTRIDTEPVERLARFAIEAIEEVINWRRLNPHEVRCNCHRCALLAEWEKS